MKKYLIISLVFILFGHLAYSQSDTAFFKKHELGFYENQIIKSLFPDRELRERPDAFSLDFSGKTFPTDISKYTVLWHSLPKSQGNTGTCWCYAATSFFESEVNRRFNIVADISEMFTVYWEYVDRAKDFAKTKGETYFAQGSEANAIKRVWTSYGIVPEEAYSGLPKNQKFHSHAAMEKEMKEYLEKMRETENWDIDKTEKDIRTILNSYMGTPPETFKYKGKE
ncbi:MAG: peptidase C1, partial [Bacteroidales bacterium]|nr:peptidase C1 [Bacteroidales bacterium]